MILSIGKDWESVSLGVTGDGENTVHNGRLSLSSGAGSGSAYADKFIEITPGDTVEISCFAKVIGAGSIGKILVATGPVKAAEMVTSTQWAKYKLVYTHPISSPDSTVVRVSFGHFTADSGGVEFMYPSIRIVSGVIGSSRTLAMGFIQILNGVPSVLSSYSTCGILGLSYDVSTKTLSVQVPEVKSSAYSLPIVDLSITSGGSPEADRLNAIFNGFGASKGEFRFRFYDHVTQGYLDIATLADVRCMLKAEIT